MKSQVSAPHTPRQQFLAKVYASVAAFFNARCGLMTNDTTTLARVPGLLRTACVGNPERTIQGELFAHLRNTYTNVVLEYRLHSFTPTAGGGWDNGRSIDIMVLDQDFLPACAIELKHLGRMQGHVGTLLDGLEADWHRFTDVEVPLILVGVYSDILPLPKGKKREEFEAFRFISCYAHHKDGRPKRLYTDCDATSETGHDWLIEWADKHCEPWIASFRGAPEEFETPAGTVAGRVHYFVGLTRERQDGTLPTTP